ncbi:hypothetical protein [Nocardia sp. NPDC060249]|uniref:hypothetical protein n=1 Tax=Nocardia sp. NPDC060249 TaxID=3347082 RepID=UPI00364FC0A6
MEHWQKAFHVDHLVRGISMPPSNLDDAFRGNAADFQAHEVFSDRDTEWAAVVDSVRNVWEAVSTPTFDVQDLEIPRRNVLVFYGVGGIGKTRLSQQIARRLGGDDVAMSHWEVPDPPLPRTVPVYLDLAKNTTFELDEVILAIRLALASHGHRAPAFDLALSRYWEACHPGESLDAYLRARTRLSRISSRLPEQVNEILGEVADNFELPGMVGGLVSQGVGALVKALRDRHDHALALRCRRLPAILEEEPDLDALSYYPHLLAWDIAQLPPKQSLLPVVLLDTFEDIAERGNRKNERLINRLVWLMPNVLFVVTGRNRLQWDDARLREKLWRTGAVRWPLLRSDTGEPRQHLVGYLSPHDRETFLAQRLVSDGLPMIPGEHRLVIAARSEGLPLYLDMAASLFVELLQSEGSVPPVQAFDRDFAELVTATFRDLTPDEQSVVRAVSVLESFSIELATTAAGLARDSAALCVVDRPFVEFDESGLWPYRVHKLVRSAIRNAGFDADSREPWSAADWRRAAQRAFDAIGVQWRAAEGDRRVLVFCLREGLRLARDFSLRLGWLEDAAVEFARDSAAEAIDIGDPPSTADGTPLPVNAAAAALAVVLSVIARRNSAHRQTIADELRAILATGDLPARIREIPEYYIAMCERDLGNFDASMRGMRKVADGGGRLAPDARRGLHHLLRRLGRFRNALEIAENLGATGRQQRALGELWWSQGNIALACTSLAVARDQSSSAGLSGEAALCQSYLAFAAAFQDRARANTQVEYAHELIGRARVGWAEVLLQVATLVVDAGHDPDLPQRADDVATSATGVGLTSLAGYARLAACFHAAVVDSPQLSEHAQMLLRESVRGAEFAYLVEIAYMFTNRDSPSTLRSDWIEGAATAKQRWSGLVTDRRAELAATERN